MQDDPTGHLEDIQWFPGHMHKAGKEIRGMYSQVNVFIEVRDARIPYSSANPMLARIRQDKPCLTVLSKADLADEALTRIWAREIGSGPDARVLAADARKPGNLARIPAACDELYRRAGGAAAQVVAMVVGIPNVGKSTLINGLAGRAVARTGNEPAVTRQQQYVRIRDAFMLLDTPGLMWPRVENRNSGFRLAVTGAIRDTAMDHLDVALFSLHHLRENHAGILSGRYGIADRSCSNEALLQAIGRRRGCLVKGGGVDMEKAARVLLSDIRSGRTGPLTWETPEMIARERSETQDRIRPGKNR